MPPQLGDPRVVPALGEPPRHAALAGAEEEAAVGKRAVHEEEGRRAGLGRGRPRAVQREVHSVVGAREQRSVRAHAV